MSDLASGGLHVEEVGGQSSLRGVRIMRGALSLLLGFLRVCLCKGASRARGKQAILERVGKTEKAERCSRGSAENSVGVCDVRVREVLHRRLQGSKASDDLDISQNMRWWTTSLKHGGNEVEEDTG